MRSSKRDSVCPTRGDSRICRIFGPAQVKSPQFRPYTDECAKRPKYKDYMTLREISCGGRHAQLLQSRMQGIHIVRVLGGAIRDTRTSDKRSRTHANRKEESQEEGPREEEGRQEGEEEAEISHRRSRPAWCHGSPRFQRQEQPVIKAMAAAPECASISGCRGQAVSGL